MNKYYIAVCDSVSWDTWIISFTAKSLKDCKDKLSEYFADYVKNDNLLNMDYPDLIDELDKNNICISDIKIAEEI